ncbi:MAG: type II toxin-antitoxin system VapC family toxin [Anaerolineae bacterium]|nr:type II toxin-antitoxin system VapC family toxin [Anaerolineae bacterium]
MSTSYVIDTTILMQGMLEETQTKRAQTLLYRATQPDDVRLHVPEFTLIECANVLWKQVRFHDETIENALRMLNDLRAFPLQTYPATGLLPRALEVAVQTQLPVYDCVHVALAENLRVALITMDTRQADAAKTVGITLKSILDFPEYTGD